MSGQETSMSAIRSSGDAMGQAIYLQMDLNLKVAVPRDLESKVLGCHHRSMASTYHQVTHARSVVSAYVGGGGSRSSRVFRNHTCHDSIREGGQLIK